MFTEHLQEFTDISRKLDTDQFTPADFLRLQKMLPEILDAYKGKNYTPQQYRILSDLYFLLMDQGRESLGR